MDLSRELPSFGKAIMEPTNVLLWFKKAWTGSSSASKITYSWLLNLMLTVLSCTWLQRAMTQDKDSELMKTRGQLNTSFTLSVGRFWTWQAKERRTALRLSNGITTETRTSNGTSVIQRKSPHRHQNMIDSKDWCFIWSKCWIFLLNANIEDLMLGILMNWRN